MPNLHIIIGDANTRKSSLIRCLTGCGSNKIIQVTQASGNVIDVYCQIGSLQELRTPENPMQFVQKIRKLTKIPTDIAITLRVDPTNGCPGFNAYLQHFSSVAHWSVMNVVLLGNSACVHQKSISASNVVYPVPNSKTQPTNQTASQVRQAWQWA